MTTMKRYQIRGIGRMCVEEAVGPADAAIQAIQKEPPKRLAALLEIEELREPMVHGGRRHGLGKPKTFFWSSEEALRRAGERVIDLRESSDTGRKT